MQIQADQERIRVQETMSKLELQMREARRHVDQDQWRTTQDAARLAVSDASITCMF